MMNIKKLAPRISITVLLIIGLILIFISSKDFLFQKEAVWKALEPSLYKKECIVDGVTEGTRTYTIISREGRTDYGDLFVVFEQNRKDTKQPWERAYENDFEGLKPWKIELADIDGDKKAEILTAVRKTTHFDQEEKNRMFIFNYDDKKLIKKWTGSLTAGEWIDFMAGDLLPIPGSELIFIEQSENGEEHLSIYYWFDFGFLGLAESSSYKDIRDFSITGENRIQITHDNGKTATLTVRNGEIVEVAPEP